MDTFRFAAADVTGAKIAVSGGSGADTIDGVELTGSNALDITSGAGLDVLRGGRYVPF